MEQLDETQKLPPPVTVRDILRILRRRAPIALFTFVVVVSATLFFTSKMKKVYEASSRIILDGPTDTATPSNIMEFIAGHNGDSLDTEMEKIRSRVFLESIIAKTKVPDLNPDILKSRLTLSTGPGGRILDVSARAATATQAKLLANTTAEQYIAFAEHEYEAKVNQSKARLHAAEARAKAEKQEAEAGLNAFTNRVGFSDPSIYYRRRAQETVDTKTQLEDLKRNLVLQQKSFNDLSGQLKRIPSEVMAGYTRVQNPVIEGYKSDLYALETQRKKMRFDYAEDSDEIKALDTEIGAKKEAITKAEKDKYSDSSKSIARNGDYSKVQSQIHDTVLGIKSTENSIGVVSRKLAGLEAEQKRLTEQQIAYEGLRRQREGANEAYEQARLGLTKMEVTGVLSAPNIHILDPAQLPLAPVSPKPVLNMVMALCLGLFLAAGMALLAEYVASGSMSEETDSDLPMVGGVPLLGTIPIALPAPVTAGAVGLPAPLGEAGRAAGYAEDALREIGYTLAHRHPKDPVPIILIAGTRSDDSTAAMAAQLTAILVRDGMRVTLVDADRHKPRLNRVFGAPDSPGLADVLAGRHKAQEILYVGADGSLRFLAAGSPDDTTPLTEAGLRAMFRDLAQDRDTDLVVVSGPSVWQAPQIAPLEKASSGMVLLAPDGAPAESVARVRRLLSNGYKPRILGLIVGSDNPLVSLEALEEEENEIG